MVCIFDFFHYDCCIEASLAEIESILFMTLRSKIHPLMLVYYDVPFYYRSVSQVNVEQTSELFSQYPSVPKPIIEFYSILSCCFQDKNAPSDKRILRLL